MQLRKGWLRREHAKRRRRTHGWLTRRQAATLAGCSERTIQRAIDAGELVAYGEGKLERIELFSFAEWLIAHAEAVNRRRDKAAA